MTYVDGFVLAVPLDRLVEYRALATLAGEVWMEHGALSYVECVADDVPYGELTSFPRAVQAKDGEVVVFSWITYPSREARDTHPADPAAPRARNHRRRSCKVSQVQVFLMSRTNHR